MCSYLFTSCIYRIISWRSVNNYNVFELTTRIILFHRDWTHWFCNAFNIAISSSLTHCSFSAICFSCIDHKLNSVPSDITFSSSFQFIGNVFSTDYSHHGKLDPHSPIPILSDKHWSCHLQWVAILLSQSLKLTHFIVNKDMFINEYLCIFWNFSVFWCYLQTSFAFGRQPPIDTGRVLLVYTSLYGTVLLWMKLYGEKLPRQETTAALHYNYNEEVLWFYAPKKRNGGWNVNIIA